MSKQETRSLLCPLSDEDLKLRGHNLAAAVKELEEVEAEKKQAVSEFGVRIKALDERIQSLAVVVKARHEARPITCEWRGDGKTGTMKLYRLDTDTVIDTRAMTVEEKQGTLNFSSSAKKAEDAKNAAAANGNGEKKAAPKKNGKAVKAAETPASV
jgi:hypothetical protein